MNILLQWFKKHHKIVFFLVLMFIGLYFFQLWRIAHNYSQSFRFGDEDAHIAGGYFLLKGYKIYQDFSANHQPLVYYFAAFVQKIFSPNSLYLFIARHREMIYLYSIIWQGIYLWVFGLYMFLFMLIFELCRYVLLGNKVLGETLAMYPFVFLIGIIIKQALFNKSISIKEVLLFSISTFITAFSLIPLWPSLLIINGYFLFLIKKNLKKVATYLTILVIFSLVLFLFVPFNEYVQQTIIDNITFVIPKLNPTFTKLNYLKSIFVPFSAFHQNPNIVEIIVISFLVLYFLIFLLIKNNKQKLIIFGLLLVILALSNNRTLKFDYGNFHILPYLALYLFIPIVFLNYYLQQKTNKKESKFKFALFIFAALIGLWLNIFGRTDYYGNLNFNLKNNLATEHYINYSNSVKYGLGIKAIKKSGDRLLAIPNDTLAFWVADIDLATRPLESFYWQYELPKYKKELYDVFTNNPPEFYLNQNINPLKNEPYQQMILKKLSSKYTRMNHLGQPSDLYVLSSKLPNITQKQWEEFMYYLFSKPNIF